MAAEQRHIDDLLQRYLGLLEEYMRLRRLLSGLQADVYQNIARANFSAERGVRYGQDDYDDRMRATRLLRIHQDETHVPVFALTGAAPAPAPTASEAPVPHGERQPGGEQGQLGDEHKGTGGTADGEPPTKTAKDPLRWFGLLAPAALRRAQSLSVEMVEQVIPRLASVHAEMLSVEIEVRRARKRRAKGLPSGRNQEAVLTQATASEAQTRGVAAETG
ncbi:hypothetical protein G6O67_006191 [Ophiocordyceps sinensis]|uniref:Vacuolar ATPase assembly protein VMA22 n=2 Tax=Ophiocordyceps sinensis TaxID=72228 RepID=A0A8H4LV07_9HYPO|nr:hypothetical protein OCS_04094 [Ophiocordyceps sinensis CO18]KAF4506070.1 hypothetical protein G6O67_006191 [Ophiocordyceps sinensis]